MKKLHDIYHLWLQGKSEYEDYQLEFEKIDFISLPTGRIVASDPIVFHSEPFQRKIQPGQYPVFICSAYEKDRDIKWTAYAILKISEKVPVRWEMAVGEGIDVESLGEDEYFGYSVDSATGCFVDQSAGKMIIDLGESILDKIASDTGSIILNDEGVNMIYFLTDGDGFFSSYWGLDENDRPVCLVTDFNAILTKEEKRQIPIRPLKVERDGEKFLVISSNGVLFAECFHESDAEVLVEADKYYYGLLRDQVRKLPIAYQVPVQIETKGPNTSEITDANGKLVTIVRNDSAQAMVYALSNYYYLFDEEFQQKVREMSKRNLPSDMNGDLSSK